MRTISITYLVITLTLSLMATPGQVAMAETAPHAEASAPDKNLEPTDLELKRPSTDTVRSDKVLLNLIVRRRAEIAEQKRALQMVQEQLDEARAKRLADFITVVPAALIGAGLSLVLGHNLDSRNWKTGLATFSTLAGAAGAWQITYHVMDVQRWQKRVAEAQRRIEENEKELQSIELGASVKEPF